MSGALIEFLVGLYFIGASLGYTVENRVTADFVKLAYGVILVVVAIAGVSPVH
jgi:hypothetical protein